MHTRTFFMFKVQRLIEIIIIGLRHTCILVHIKREVINDNQFRRAFSLTQMSLVVFVRRTGWHTITLCLTLKGVFADLTHCC